MASMVGWLFCCTGFVEVESGFLYVDVSVAKGPWIRITT